MGGSCPWQQLPGAKPGLDGGCDQLLRRRQGCSPPSLLLFDASDATIWTRTGAKQLPAGGAPLIWEPGPISGVVSCGPGWW